jgi:hypothetical protein
MGSVREKGRPRESTGKGFKAEGSSEPVPMTVVGSSEEIASQENRTSFLAGEARLMVNPVDEEFSIHHSLPTLPCGVAVTAGTPLSGAENLTVTPDAVFGTMANPACRPETFSSPATFTSERNVARPETVMGPRTLSAPVDISEPISTVVPERVMEPRIERPEPERIKVPEILAEPERVRDAAWRVEPEI